MEIEVFEILRRVWLVSITLWIFVVGFVLYAEKSANNEDFKVFLKKHPGAFVFMCCCPILNTAALGAMVYLVIRHY